MGRTTQVEGVILRSLRLGEADRVLHVYTRERGRVGLVAKGVRRTRSRFGARLEPLTRVNLQMHLGRGELGTVTGADIVESHRLVREDPARLAVGLAGAETVARLFAEGEASPRAFEALCRFLEALEVRDAPGRSIARDPGCDSPIRTRRDSVRVAFVQS
jgi:DNA repair protein RecO (recombination protein O)